MRVLKTTSIAILVTVSTVFFGVSDAPAVDACARPPEGRGTITLITDWLPASTQGPFYAAQMKGFYKDEQLNVDIVSPAGRSGTTDAIKLVANQRAHFGITYMLDVMTARETGIPVVSVAALWRFVSWGLIVRPEVGITSPAGLKGKTVAAAAIPVTRAFIRTMFEHVGLSPKDVNIVDPAYGAPQMLMAGTVDAASGTGLSTLVSVNLRRAKDGKPPMLFWPYTDYGVPKLYFLVLATNERWLKTHRAVTCHFLRATAKGYDEFATNPDPYNRFFTEKNPLPLEEHATITRVSLPYWRGPDGKLFRQDEKVWSSGQAWALEQKLISIRVKPNEFFSNDYVP